MNTALKPIANIGDLVWIASYQNEQKWITCPDCAGEKYHTVILGNKEAITIACECCGERYHSSDSFRPGQVQVYEYVKKAEPYRITGITLNETGYDPGITYLSGCHSIKKVYLTKEEAEAASEILCAEAEIAEQEQEAHQKRTRAETWAWNIHYYRQKIKQAEKDIEYCTPKLAYAKEMAKKFPVKDKLKEVS